MLEWYTDIKKLIEVSGAERNAFVSGAVHGRQGSIDAAKEEEIDDLDNDEADEIPYSTAPSALEVPVETAPKRPEGGRFPSDININRGTSDVRIAADEDSSRSIIGAAGALPGNHGRPRSGSQSSTWSYDEKVCIAIKHINFYRITTDNRSTLFIILWKMNMMNSCLLEQRSPQLSSVVCLSGTITPSMKL